MKINRLICYGGVILNLLLLAGLILGEHYGHGYADALERRGIIERDYSKNPNWAVNGWTNTLQKMHYDCDIVFLGNSITAGSDFQSSFQDKKIVNLGYCGDIIPGMINRIEMVKAVSPEKIFIMAGTNDLVHVSIEKYVERYDSLISGLQRNLPDAKIYIQSVLPANHELASDYIPNAKVKDGNDAIKKLAESKGCTYINLYDLYEVEGEMKKELSRDGIHLKPEAYDIWAEAIREYVYE